jgi:hypothetical protein
MLIRADHFSDQPIDEPLDIRLAENFDAHLSGIRSVPPLPILDFEPHTLSNSVRGG